jgi:hypothetical protein
MREIGPRPWEPHPDPAHFERIRRLAIEREQGACAGCYEKDRPLEAHHRTYERWGREELGDIYMFCHECHDLFTSAQWKVRALRRQPLPPPLVHRLEIERPPVDPAEPMHGPALAAPSFERTPRVAAASIVAATLPAPVLARRSGRRPGTVGHETRRVLQDEEET